MKCSNCGAELPESSQYCNKCGAKVDIGSKKHESYQESGTYNAEQILPQSPEKNIYNIEKNHSKNVRRVLIVSLSLVLVVFICVYFLYPVIKYNNAVSSLNSKDYNQAIKTFEQLGNYKDSHEQIKKCEYQQAKELLSSKKYSKATQAFTKLGSYADSKNLTKESEYGYAKDSMQNMNYVDAISAFEKLKDYKDSSALLREAQYNLAGNYYDNGKFSDSANLYESISDYKDSKDKLAEAIYCDAKAEYTNGDFDKANTQFEKIKPYKDSKNYLTKLETLLRIQGTWEVIDNKYTQKTFNGWKVACIAFPDSNKTNVVNLDYEFNNSKLVIASNDSLELKDDKLIETYSFGISTYKKISASEVVPVSSPEPSIGMTAEEVKNSKWGSPDEINKTTTASTVHEQWVYPNNKYIYLDNGIVTAIQD